MTTANHVSSSHRDVHRIFVDEVEDITNQVFWVLKYPQK